MKYICMKNDDGEIIITFPNSIDHDCMAEACREIKNQSRGRWRRVFRVPVSAGFVDRMGKCYGRSETLNLDSRPVDTDILNRQSLEIKP